MNTFVMRVGRLAPQRRMDSRVEGRLSRMQSAHWDPTAAGVRQSVQAGRPQRVQARPVAREGWR